MKLSIVMDSGESVGDAHCQSVTMAMQDGEITDIHIQPNDGRDPYHLRLPDQDHIAHIVYAPNVTGTPAGGE